MTIDSILAFLKFFAILLTGIIGIAGLLLDYKDEQGRITKWGRRVLIGLTTSALTAAMIQGLEVYKQKEEARTAANRYAEEIKRTNIMLQQINRAVYSINNIHLSASYSLPMANSHLESFRRKIAQATRTAALEESKHISVPTAPALDGVSIQFDPDNKGRYKPTGAYIKSYASIYPQKGRDEIAWAVLNSIVVHVDLFRIPMSPDKYNDVRTRPTFQDIDLQLEGMAVRPAFWYDFRNKQMVVEGYPLTVGTDNISGKGTIASVPDLSGSQMFIRFRCDNQYLNDKISGEVYSLLRSIRLETFGFRVGTKDFVIHPERLEASKDVIYSYIFPKDLEIQEGIKSEHK